VPRLSFWVHQVAEYVLAFALIMQATNGGRVAVAVGMGGVLLIAAATADGPLSGWKAVSRPTHRIVDIVIAAALIGLAVVPGTGIDPLARTIMGMVGLAEVLLILRTDYRPRPERARRRPDAEEVGRVAGRVAGGAISKGMKAYKERGGPKPE
jgi:hypothetical protein